MTDTATPQAGELDHDTSPEPSATSAKEVTLRVASECDEVFLLNLFATTRSDELAVLAGNPAQAQMFITMQYRAQKQSYEAVYPAAENKIILLHDEPVGRILVDRSSAEFHLVDIAILPQHRNAGLGGNLLRDLLGEATQAAKPVKLLVVSYNPARRLYERLGFYPIGNDGLYVEMLWSNPA